MKLSFSKYETYLTCPKKYKYQVDRVPLPEPENKYFALYGILIQKFFENYSNYYAPKKKKLDNDTIKSILGKEWSRVLSKEPVNWKDPWVKSTPEQIFEEVYSDVLENLETFDFWNRTKSEVSYDIALINSGDVINGRIDFIVTEPNGDVILLDGKGTKDLEKVNPEQLLFYALMYFLKHKVLPKKLGFLYYKFKIIRYIDFNRDILIAFKNKLALAKKAIKIDTNFEAKVKLSKNCLWCPYKLLCSPYTDKKAANAEKRRKIKLDPEGDIIFFGTNK